MYQAAFEDRFGGVKLLAGKSMKLVWLGAISDTTVILQLLAVEFPNQPAQ